MFFPGYHAIVKYVCRSLRFLEENYIGIRHYILVFTIHVNRAVNKKYDKNYLL